MGRIKIDNKPRHQIDNDYETWHNDKEYWVEKFDGIINSYKFKCPSETVLINLQYKLHRWQMHVNTIFNIKNIEAITVSFDFDNNTLQINMNEELQTLFE